MHSPNPRPFVSILILFTKLFSCFLCVLVIFSIGTRGSRALVLLFAVSLRYLACTFYFLTLPCMLLAVIVSDPPLPTPSACVHPYSSRILPVHLRSLPLLLARAVKLLCPVVPLAFRTPSLPTHFSILANASSFSLPPVRSVVHRHSLPLF